MEDKETVVEKEKTTNEEKDVVTFDDILKDKAYQSEFDKRISKAIGTAKTKWEQESQTKQSEADKISKMNDDEKKDYNLKKIEEERDKATSELNAYKLKEASIKIAKEKGIDPELLDIIDFSKETADTVNSKLEILSNKFKNATEKALNDKLKETTPKTKVNETAEKKSISRASY